MRTVGEAIERDEMRIKSIIINLGQNTKIQKLNKKNNCKEITSYNI